MTQPPQRVRVTRTRSADGPRRPSLRTEVRRQSSLGATYLDALMRVQLLLSLRVLVIGGTALGSLPLLFLLVPATRRLTVGGIPFAWLVLGVAVYPAAVITARYYTRSAERIEAQFADVVGPR